MAFFGLLMLEAPFVALENQLVDSRMRSAPFRKEHGSAAGALPVKLGLWDEAPFRHLLGTAETPLRALRARCWQEKRITSLQLVVCLSLALGVDEAHVTAQLDGSFFYTCFVHREGAWVIAAVNEKESRFLETLNAQAQRFGARLVITHDAESVTNSSSE